MSAVSGTTPVWSIQFLHDRNAVTQERIAPADEILPTERLDVEEWKSLVLEELDNSLAVAVSGLDEGVSVDTGTPDVDGVGRD